MQTVQTKHRSRLVGYSSLYARSSPTYPNAPYCSVTKDAFGRMVIAQPKAYLGSDRSSAYDEAIAASDKHKNEYRSCVAVKSGDYLAFSRKTFAEHVLPTIPLVLSKASAQAISASGSTIPSMTRPVSQVWVPALAPEVVPWQDCWDSLRRQRPGIESDLYAGLASAPSVSRDLRAAIELRDSQQTIEAYGELVKFATAAASLKHGSRTNAEVLRSATVVEVARQYLTWRFGVQATYSDARAWCDRELAKKPVKLSIHQPVEYGGTIRRAFVVDPHGGLADQQESVSTLTEYNRSWSYSNSSVQGGQIDVDPVDRAISDWQSSGLRSRPLSRSLLKGIFFGRISKPELVTELETLGTEVSYSMDNSITTEMTPLRDFILAVHPLSTSWQTTPFTFLIDWIVNVTQSLRDLELALASVKKRLTLVEGVWLSVRDVRVAQFPKVQLTAVTSNQLVGFTDTSFTSRISGTVRRKVSWVDIEEEKVYQRSPADALLGPPQTISQGFKIDLKLNAYTLSAGAALLVTRLPLAKKLQVLLRTRR